MWEQLIEHPSLEALGIAILDVSIAVRAVSLSLI